MNGLDPTIHPLPRLSVCALLAAGADWVEFRAVREATGLSDSMVSKLSRTLEDAGYLEVRKGAEGRRPRTWFRITDRGLDAYRGHVDAPRRMTEEPGQPRRTFKWQPAPARWTSGRHRRGIEVRPRAPRAPHGPDRKEHRPRQAALLKPHAR